MSGRLGEFTKYKGDGNGLMRHVQLCVGFLAVGTLGPMPIPYQAIFLGTPFSRTNPQEGSRARNSYGFTGFRV